MPLALPQLETFYQRGKSFREATAADWQTDKILLAGLNLNIREASVAIYEQPTYEAFEQWVIATGAPSEQQLARLRRAFANEPVGPPVALDDVEGLSAEDLAHWDEHGYVILRNAVTREQAEAAERAIYQHRNMDPHDPETWYTQEQGHTIWVPLLRDPALVATRNSARIAKAFAQLWGREDLWATVDQAGFNPPERKGWLFHGPHLHWDTTLAEPHYLGVQGILYLADVAADQGAFACVPGFHRTLRKWLRTVPADADPREHALANLTLQPIAANRGDLVLWHQSLPHGATPNNAARPRVVQYISMYPTEWKHNELWQ